MKIRAHLGMRDVLFGERSKRYETEKKRSDYNCCKHHDTYSRSILGKRKCKHKNVGRNVPARHPFTFE